MSAWTLIPCLVTLRKEFDTVSPHRDRGADGSIGDSNHTSSSDHAPDEDSSVLRDRDADHTNEVHALDIDSTGPWPDAGWFNRTVLALVEREKAEYESPTIVGRLQYVIHDHRIASRSWGWSWRDYDGEDPHTNHAHFSARYLSSTEADTRPWGVYEEDDVDLTDTDIEKIAAASWNHFLTVAGSGATVRAGTILGYNDSLHVGTRRMILDALAAHDAGDDKALADLRAAVDKVPGAVAAAFPVDRIVDELSQRLPAVSREDLEEALRAVLGSLDTVGPVA